MTASERMTKLLSTTPEEKVNSSLFWGEHIEKHLGSSNANDIEDYKFSEALFFMHMSATMLEMEFVKTMPTKEVYELFEQHVNVWNRCSVVKLKKVLKKST